MAFSWFLPFLVLMVYLFPFCGGQASCTDRCGEPYYRGHVCHCDYDCLIHNECCKNYESTCTTSHSCKGRCGESFKRGKKCHCDPDCLQYKQCCPDYETHCSKAISTDKVILTTPSYTLTKQTQYEHDMPMPNSMGVSPGFEMPSTDEPSTEMEADVALEFTESPSQFSQHESTPGTTPTTSSGDVTIMVTTNQTYTEIRGHVPEYIEAVSSVPSQEGETLSTKQYDEYTLQDEPALVHPTVSPNQNSSKPGPKSSEMEMQPGSEGADKPGTKCSSEGKSSISLSSDKTVHKNAPESTPISDNTSPTLSQPYILGTSPQNMAHDGPYRATTETIPMENMPSETSFQTETTTSDSDVDKLSTHYEITSPATGLPATPVSQSEARDPAATVPTNVMVSSAVPSTKPSKPKPTKETSVAETPAANNPADYLADDSNDTNLCSGRPINGLTTLSNGTVAVFRGHYFWMLNANREPGPARGITDVWGIPSPIDTVFTRCNCQGKTYFFKGYQYWRFENDAMDPGFPKTISKGFGGLLGTITAALSAPAYRDRPESVFFFKRGGFIQRYTYKHSMTPTCGRPVKYAIVTKRREARQADLGLENAVKIRMRGFPSLVTSAISIPTKQKPDGYDYYIFSRTKYYSIKIDGKLPVLASPSSAETEKNSAKNWFKCP